MNKKQKALLITGGLGGIGSEIVDCFYQKNFTIIILNTNCLLFNNNFSFINNSSLLINKTATYKTTTIILIPLIRLQQ